MIRFLLLAVVFSVTALQTSFAVPTTVEIARSLKQVPTVRTLAWRSESKLTTQILQHWARRPLGNWQTEGKIEAPRALLARLLLKRDVKAANDYLLQLKPWGNVGSKWPMHPAGDYDFTLTGLTPILFLFGDDPQTLYPATRDHLLNELLTAAGGEPQIYVPNSFGQVRDTENHILMTEGSRFLKNRWLALHGNSETKHDNVANGLEAWLLTYLGELKTSGFHEFNSIPYEGYTLTALLNLEAFASQPIQQAARDLLDALNWKYALGSQRMRRFPPFRRQFKHAQDTSLTGDRHTALVQTWLSRLPTTHQPAKQPFKSLSSRHIAIWACWAPYQLPDRCVEWLRAKPSDYFIRYGHGKSASPELYSGGPGYLLTAGGVYRGDHQQIVARPITLLLDSDANKDGAKLLDEVIHLAGPGTNFRQWSNTGVHRRFAVAAGPVHIPQGWQAVAANATWSIYCPLAESTNEPNGSLCIAVHSQPKLGILHLSRSADPQTMLRELTEANSDPKQLEHRFHSPAGIQFRYAPSAPQNRWVIQEVNDQKVDRNFDSWPLIEAP